MVLAGHRSEPADLPEQPFQHRLPPAQVGRQKLPSLVGQVHQDRAGFEYRERLAAVRRRVIDDRRHSIVRADRQELRLELLAGADVHRDDPVVEPGFLEKHRDFVPVRRRPVVEIDHHPSHCAAAAPAPSFRPPSPLRLYRSKRRRQEMVPADLPANHVALRPAFAKSAAGGATQNAIRAPLPIRQGPEDWGHSGRGLCDTGKLA